MEVKGALGKRPAIMPKDYIDINIRAGTLWYRVIIFVLERLLLRDCTLLYSDNFSTIAQLWLLNLAS